MAGAERGPSTPPDPDQRDLLENAMSKTPPRNMLSGGGSFIYYDVVAAGSPLLPDEKDVARLGDSDRLVVSSSIPDKPSSYPDGRPRPAQSDVLRQFVTDEQTRASQDGETAPKPTKSYLTVEEVRDQLTDQAAARKTNPGLE